MKLTITRNGVSVHVLDMAYVQDRLKFESVDRAEQFMDTHYQRLPEIWLHLEPMQFWYTLGAYAFDYGRFLWGESATIDYALPMGSEFYGKPGYVWLYDAESPISGRAINIWRETELLISSIVRTYLYYMDVAPTITVE